MLRFLENFVTINRQEYEVVRSEKVLHLATQFFMNASN